MEVYEVVRDLGVDVGNLRVSSWAVEFDLLVDSKRTVDRAVSFLVKQVGGLITIRELDRSSRQQNSDEAIRVGISLFNEERYWESHESFESAWLTAAGSAREVLQAIILLAAALVHLQKDEFDIALSITRRADAKLPNCGVLFQIDLEQLKGMVSRILVEGRPIFFKLPMIKAGQTCT
ncbi:MAG: DUF309 domain-containing protein [Candidatus Bathyarchaeia archaeon]